MLRIAFVILWLGCSITFGDAPPNSTFRVQSTSLNLTIMDEKSVAHEPTDCFLIFLDSSMVLLFRHAIPDYTAAEGAIWKITAFDHRESKAIGYVKRTDSRNRQKMQMTWDSDGRLGVELIDDVRQVRGQQHMVQFGCEPCDENTARQVISEILETKPLRLPPQAREKLLTWLKNQDGEP